MSRVVKKGNKPYLTNRAEYRSATADHPGGEEIVYVDEGDNLDPAQRAKRDEYLRIVQEYKDFDMDAYRKELMGNFTAETDKINVEQDTHKSSLNKRLDELDRLHGEHKGLQKDNERTNKQRREILAKVEE